MSSERKQRRDTSEASEGRLGTAAGAMQVDVHSTTFVRYLSLRGRDGGCGTSYLGASAGGRDGKTSKKGKKGNTHSGREVKKEGGRERKKWNETSDRRSEGMDWMEPRFILENKREKRDNTRTGCPHGKMGGGRRKRCLGGSEQGGKGRSRSCSARDDHTNANPN